MSQRTIVEINHDLAFVTKEEAGVFCGCLRQAISSGSPESWEPLKRWGFNRIVQTHHTDDRKVVTKYAEYEIG